MAPDTAAYDRATERHIKEALALANSHADPTHSYFSAGWSMPGYLPETEYEVFDNVLDALGYLRDSLEGWANGIDHADDGALAMSYESAIARVEQTIRTIEQFNVTAGFTFPTVDYAFEVLPISKADYEASRRAL
jgi:hypothetical protein